MKEINHLEEFKKVLMEMNKKELEEVKQAILNGQLLRDIDIEIDKKTNARCSVCEAPLGENYYELRWKSFGMVKRARFDGLDCLSYFIAALRNRKEKIRRRKNESRRA